MARLTGGARHLIAQGDTPRAQRRCPPFEEPVHLTFTDVTGLIYVAIVALWAAVLIPMWLRRHDDDQARRIERHRVAMGTLARMSTRADAARELATRRRRVALTVLATLGALGSAAWIAGLTPGVLAALLWLPFVAFLPVVLLAERRSVRHAAERALVQSREHRREEVAPETPVAEPATPARLPRPLAPTAWDEVFDQTA